MVHQRKMEVMMMIDENQRDGDLGSTPLAVVAFGDRKGHEQRNLGSL